MSRASRALLGSRTSHEEPVPRSRAAPALSPTATAARLERNRDEARSREPGHSSRALSRQEDPYPTAVVLAQRLSVALEDLARLLIAFEALPTDNAFDVLRSAAIDELDAVYRRLAGDPEAFRSEVRLPRPEDTEDLDAELREAVLEASDALARRWLAH